MDADALDAQRGVGRDDAIEPRLEPRGPALAHGERHVAIRQEVHLERARDQRPEQEQEEDPHVRRHAASLAERGAVRLLIVPGVVLAEEGRHNQTNADPEHDREHQARHRNAIPSATPISETARMLISAPRGNVVAGPSPAPFL